MKKLFLGTAISLILTATAANAQSVQLGTNVGVNSGSNSVDANTRTSGSTSVDSTTGSTGSTSVDANTRGVGGAVINGSATTSTNNRGLLNNNRPVNNTRSVNTGVGIDATIDRPINIDSDVQAGTETSIDGNNSGYVRSRGDVSTDRPASQRNGKIITRNNESIKLHNNR